VGIDIAPQPKYPGEFRQLALPVTLDELRQLDPALIVASPPCDQYARWALPWIKGPFPDTSLLAWSIRLADYFPAIIECNRASARLFPGARFCGPYALWGHLPPLLPPTTIRKQRMTGQNPAARAMIDPSLADWIIEYHTRRLLA